jgi:hypothetical protein
MTNPVIDQAVSALVTAAMNGTRQIKGMHHDDAGGRCALGVMPDEVAWGLGLVILRPRACPACGARTQSLHLGQPIANVDDLVMHLNNDHAWDFLSIARKMESLAVGDKV